MPTLDTDPHLPDDLAKLVAAKQRGDQNAAVEILKVIVARQLDMARAQVEREAAAEDANVSRKGKLFGVIPYSYKPSRLRAALDAVDAVQFAARIVGARFA